MRMMHCVLNALGQGHMRVSDTVNDEVYKGPHSCRHVLPALIAYVVTTIGRNMLCEAGRYMPLG